MDIYYFHAPEGNFGDDINGWLWEALMGTDVIGASPDTVFVGIGTILDHHIPPKSRKIVFGSGAGYHPVSNDFGDESWDIRCVRGPLTAALLGLPQETAVTDGAILLASLPDCAPVPEAERHGIVFMPHVGALKTGAWQEVCKKAGVEFLDPRQDSKVTLDRLRHAKLVLADAMHAAIVADAVRVPWIPFTTSAEINSFKWVDWASSLGAPYEPVHLYASTILDQLKNVLYTVFRLKYNTPENLDAQQLVALFRKIMVIRKSRWHAFAERVVNAVLKRLGKLVRGTPILDKWMLRLSRGTINRAAQKIKEAATQKGYLSADTVHAERLEEMQKRLAAVVRNAQCAA